MEMNVNTRNQQSMVTSEKLCVTHHQCRRNPMYSENIHSLQR